MKTKKNWYSNNNFQDHSKCLFYKSHVVLSIWRWCYSQWNHSIFSEYIAKPSHCKQEDLCILGTFQGTGPLKDTGNKDRKSTTVKPVLILSGYTLLHVRPLGFAWNLMQWMDLCTSYSSLILFVIRFLKHWSHCCTFSQLCLASDHCKFPRCRVRQLTQNRCYEYRLCTADCVGLGSHHTLEDGLHKLPSIISGCEDSLSKSCINSCIGELWLSCT